jgi:hypothetical protein
LALAGLVSGIRHAYVAVAPIRRQEIHGTPRIGIPKASLEHALREVPCPRVRRAEVSAAGLDTVSADPLYARNWGRGWRALRQGIESDTADERM